MSDATFHERVSALFLELRELSGEERAAALAALEDRQLRDDVTSLLEHDVPDGTAMGLDQIGPYRIVAPLGRGGSGHVLLAEQEEPVRRRVAIKIVPQAALSPELAARFETERRALEATAHPHIVAILDAGRTPDGLPYLVMDYVEGETITAWCEQRGLPLAERVALLLDVAEAVQHAHQRGVIHRDLKPANVLVTEIDGRAVPKVLDFGIARPVADDRPALTATGLALGTPSYMAPEQTGGRPVDTRADVYALGALLYELVAGRPPVEAGPDPLETLRRVREQVPPPAGSLRALSGPPSLRADLDLIAGKALEKDADRRYPTVAALAEDLRRALRFEPVMARAPTWRYRAARFARRNRALAAALLLVALGLVVGAVGLTTGLIEAQRQQAEATLQGEAQREINRFLTEDLLAAASPYREGDKVTVRELLDQASDRLATRFPDRPLVAASVHYTLGESYGQLGSFDKAEEHLSRAVEMRRALAGVDAPDTVRAEIAAASVLGMRQDFEAARAALIEVVPRARLVLGPDDPILYTALSDLGVALLVLDRNDEAITVLEEAIAGRRRLLGEFDPMVPLTMNQLAMALEQRGEDERALDVMKEALALAEAAPDPSPMALMELNNSLGAAYQDRERDEEARPYLARSLEIARDWLGMDHPTTLNILANLAGLESELGDPRLAAQLYQAIAQRRAEMLGPDAIDTLTARYGRWNAMRQAQRYREAATGFEELLADIETALPEDHWLGPQTRASWAHALMGSGRHAEALEQARLAEAELSAQFGPDHLRTRSATVIIEALSGGASGGGD